MAGYTRQDTANNIANGNVIDADDFDAEYNAVESAFNASAGHKHDGTAGEGAPITKVGPSQDLVVSATNVLPKTTNTLDLGSVGAKFKNSFFDGTVTTDDLAVTGGSVLTGNATVGGTLGVTGAATLSSTAAITGNTTVGGTLGVTGASTLASAAVTNNATVGGTLAVTGNSTLGGTLGVTGQITGNVTGNTAGTHTGAVTGNASTATALQTARSITIDGDVDASATNFDGTGNITLTTTLDTVNSNVGSFGSSTAIPVVTVNGKGLVTGVSTASITTALTVGADSGSNDSVALATDTLNFAGTANEIETAVSNNQIQIGLPSAVTVGSLTTSGNVIVGGNLTVSGTTTTVNTETINLADNQILLNSNETGTPSQNGGIEIERGTETNKTLVWNETDDKWTVGSETFVAGTFEGNLTGAVTGNASTATTAAALTGNVTKSGDFTIDSSGDIILDADGGDFILKDDGTTRGKISVVNTANLADKVDFYAGSGTALTDLEMRINTTGVNISGGLRVGDLTTPSGTGITAQGDITTAGDVVAVSDVTAATGNVSAGGEVVLTAGAQDWTFEVDSSNRLVIQYNGTSLARIDTNGNLVVKGDVTAFGTL